MTSLFNPGNEPTTFTILPKNGSLYLTLNEDSLVYDKFCVDRAFKPKASTTSSKAASAGFGKLGSSGSSQSLLKFVGTTAVFCQPGLTAILLAAVVTFTSLPPAGTHLGMSTVLIHKCGFKIRMLPWSSSLRDTALHLSTHKVNF